MQAGNYIKYRLEAVGHWFFYVAMLLFGHRGGLVLLVPVVSVYVLFSRKIRGTVRHYLNHRFPGERGFKYWLYTYKNVYTFGHVLVDRGWIGLKKKGRFDCDLVGYETLVELIEKKNEWNLV